MSWVWGRDYGRLVVKGRTVAIVANMSGCASSTIQKVLDEALSELEDNFDEGSELEEDGTESDGEI